MKYMTSEEIRQAMIENYERIIAECESEMERCRENIKYDTQCLKEARQEGYTEDIEYWISERKNDYKEFQRNSRKKIKNERDLLTYKISVGLR